MTMHQIIIRDIVSASRTHDGRISRPQTAIRYLRARGRLRARVRESIQRIHSHVYGGNPERKGPVKLYGTSLHPPSWLSSVGQFLRHQGLADNDISVLCRQIWRTGFYRNNQRDAALSVIRTYGGSRDLEIVINQE